MGKAAGDPFQVGKNPIPSLLMKTGEGGAKKLAVIHRGTWNWAWAEGESTFLEGFHDCCRAVIE
jgi:hypothetical protein